MNYQETLNYLYEQLPMFHRIGAAAYKADLKNIQALCESLDHPEKKFRSVHVAGTNGKGSVSSMIAAILTESGYKTGLFTSPHLKDFRERIRINGKMIPEKEVIHFVEFYKKHFSSLNASFFEWNTALAMNYFAEEKVEIAVMETGMGGKLDSTNVITPELSVITNIGWDHMQFLGDTLVKIANEKAGIIKEEVPVIIGEVQEDIAHVFTSRAEEMRSSCVFAPLLWNAVSHQETKISEDKLLSKLSAKQEIQEYQCLDIRHQGVLVFENLELDLCGDYQKKNILPVMQAVFTLREKGFYIPNESLRSALKKVKQLSGIRGRWEVIQRKPLVVADTAHNVPGLTEVMKQIRRQEFKQLHFILGLVNDKDISAILSLMPIDATYYFCNASIPRAMESSELKSKGNKAGLKGISYGSVSSAFAAAMNAAGEKDMVFIGGSTFVVAEVL